METFIGFITPFPWNWPPYGWSVCNGNVIAIAQNQALFALLGTSFGGNGTQTFGLPDLRGKQVIGYGQAAYGTVYDFAQQGGQASVTLTGSQVPLPSHTHTATFTPTGGSSANLSVSTETPSVATPQLANGDTAYLANATGGAILKGLYTKTAPAAGATASIPVNGGGGGGTVTVNPNGNTAAGPVPLMNPYLALNFCIALQGIFPSRN